MAKSKGNGKSVVGLEAFKKEPARFTETRTEVPSESESVDVLLDETNNDAEEVQEVQEAAKKEVGCRRAKRIEFDEIELDDAAQYLLSGRIMGDQLIVHAWSEKARRRMREEHAHPELKAQRKKNPPPRHPEEEFQAARYIVEEKDCIPSVMLKNAMVYAGMRMGRSKADLREAIYITGEYLPIKHREVVAREDSVMIGPWNKRSADLRYRPAYLDWSIDFQIRFGEDKINPRGVLLLLRKAGHGGLGEWRPQRGGQFGTFTIDMESLELKIAAPPPEPDFLARFHAMKPTLSASA